MKQIFRNKYYGNITYDWQDRTGLTLPVYPAVYDAVKNVQAHTYGDIAEYLGISISKVGRTLNELQQVGLVSKIWIAKGEDAEL